MKRKVIEYGTLYYYEGKMIYTGVTDRYEYTLYKIKCKIRGWLTEEVIEKVMSLTDRYGEYE